MKPLECVRYTQTRKEAVQPYTHAVVQYSMKPFSFIKKFDKIVDAVKELGLDQAKISAVCLGIDRRKSTGGEVFATWRTGKP
jgi:hypothetical protein